MCGIVGVIGPRAAGQDLKESLDALSHRGPDRKAQIHTGKALLGHTRLSIIDTSSGGDQPMQDPSGRYTLVFNGEIYNYRTIAQQLESEGIIFTGQSDTEVVLHLLIQEGSEGLRKLNGFFALAFYDSQVDRCLIVRDRIGIKPLFYSDTEEGLTFCSEMSGLLPLLSQHIINPTALHFYLRLNYIPDPLTILHDVQELEPGHYLIMEKGNVSKHRYYFLKEQIKKTRKESLRELLTDSVRSRMIADVPLGSFLSGGVDSSIIAALASQEQTGLKTFSIGFRDNVNFDESRYAERVAEHVGSDHTTIQLYEEEMLNNVEGVLDSISEPFADSSAIAVYALCEHTRKHVTVALSGDGADELFGGYHKHQAHLMASSSGLKVKVANALSKMLKRSSGSYGSAMQNRIRRLKRFSQGVNLHYDQRYWSWASWTAEKEVSELLVCTRDEKLYRNVLKDYSPADDSMEEILLSDTHLVLPNDMLRKVDRMSMANSLEVRVPFLDHRVVEYAHSLSASERFSKGRGKYILRAEFGDLLPRDIFDRKKKGFEVPLESWFNGPLNARVQGVLNDGRLAETSWFSSIAMNELKQKVKRKQIGADVHLLWALMVLHSFLKRF